MTPRLLPPYRLTAHRPMRAPPTRLLAFPLPSRHDRLVAPGSGKPIHRSADHSRNAGVLPLGAARGDVHPSLPVAIASPAPIDLASSGSALSLRRRSSERHPRRAIGERDAPQQLESGAPRIPRRAGSGNISRQFLPSLAPASGSAASPSQLSSLVN